MSQGRSHGGLRPVVLVALVVFAFWRPLLAGGSMVPDDQLWRTDPYNAAPPAELSIEVAEDDAIAVHSAWVRWADDVRGGDLSWWQDAGDGRPFLADGLPVTHLAYLLVPDWYAPGLVAALAVLLAGLGAMRLADRRGLHPTAGLFAGVAFGFSGLMFVWLGWPHATAIALVPWVLDAASALADRRRPASVVGLAIAVALQLWCGVFAIAAFTIVAALLVAVLDTDRRERLAAAANLGVGFVAGAALAAPHLVPRWERWRWADTSSLESVGDVSASVAALATAGFGSVVGNEAVGVPWLTSGTLQHSTVFVGLTTVGLALLGSFAGRRVAGPIAVSLIGVAVAFVGGPFAVVAGWLIGDGSLVTHARPLVVIGIVLLAAHGLDALFSIERPSALRVRVAGVPRVVWPLIGGSAIVVVAAAGETVRDGDAVRQVAAQAWSVALVAVVLGGSAIVWWQRRFATAGVAAVCVAVVAYELLAFGMPIPTVVEPDIRPIDTAAHAELVSIVGEHGRVAGDHNGFAPSVAARFGYGDVRTGGLRSAGEIAAFRAVDPSSTFAAVGGSDFAPVIRVTDPAVDPSRHPSWDLLGVDAWVLPFDAAPPGPWESPSPDARTPVAVAPPFGSVEVPEHGLRAVVLDLRVPAFTKVTVEVVGIGASIEHSVVLRTARDGDTAIALPAEMLDPGPAQVAVSVDTNGDEAEIGTVDGSVAVGTVGGDADRSLVWVDGALILSRPTPRAVWLGDPDADVTVVDESAGRLVLSVDATAAGTLRLDIVDEPGWSVRVDGAEVAHTSVEDLVIGVDVAPGVSVVEVEYRPPGLLAGLAIAVAALLGLAAWWGLDRRRGSPVAEEAAGRF